jgi:hypothetical protein
VSPQSPSIHCAERLLETNKALFSRDPVAAPQLPKTQNTCPNLKLMLYICASQNMLMPVISPSSLMVSQERLRLARGPPMVFLHLLAHGTAVAHRSPNCLRALFQPCPSWATTAPAGGPSTWPLNPLPVLELWGRTEPHAKAHSSSPRGRFSFYGIDLLYHAEPLRQCAFILTVMFAKALPT